MTPATTQALLAMLDEEGIGNFGTADGREDRNHVQASQAAVAPDSVDHPASRSEHPGAGTRGGPTLRRMVASAEGLAATIASALRHPSRGGVDCAEPADAGPRHDATASLQSALAIVCRDITAMRLGPTKRAQFLAMLHGGLLAAGLARSDAMLVRQLIEAGTRQMPPS